MSNVIHLTEEDALALWADLTRDVDFAVDKRWWQTRPAAEKFAKAIEREFGRRWRDDVNRFIRPV